MDRSNKKKLAKSVKCQTLGTHGVQKANTRKKKVPKKKLLKAPFQHKWPAVSDDLSGNVINSLTSAFISQGIQRKLCTRKGKKVQSAGDTNNHDSVQCTKWRCIIFGINAVTRAMEKGDVSLLLCDSNVHQLTSHLIELSVHNQIPAASITGLSSISESVGLYSMTCLAFKPLNDIEDECLKSMVTSITNIIPKIESPIIPKMNLSQLSGQGFQEDAVIDRDAEIPSTLLNLPPDDIDFASLYVFKKDLEFNKQENFISLSSSLKRKSDVESKKVTTKKLRYMSTETGEFKYNPDRPQHEKTKGKPKMKKKTVR